MEANGLCLQMFYLNISSCAETAMHPKYFSKQTGKKAKLAKKSKDKTKQLERVTSAPSAVSSMLLAAIDSLQVRVTW